ncbi:MAG: putative enzyme related to lactoylglutathione lyase [Candidatus Woesearchaeota archaeon]|jgi:predicted enzyme related to lactoylglutathione lyase
MRNLVGWFEIPVTDIQRAKKFYETLFECTLEDAKMEQCDMFFFPGGMESPGAMGALVKGENYKPSADGVLIYFAAPQDDIPLGLKRAAENGGKVILEKMSLGEHGFMGGFIDTEGNRIAIHSMK